MANKNSQSLCSPPGNADGNQHQESCTAQVLSLQQLAANRKQLSEIKMWGFEAGFQIGIQSLLQDWNPIPNKEETSGTTG